MKKLLTICICFCVIFAMAIIPTRAQSVTSSGVDMKEQMAAQKNAVIANELLYNTFELTPTGYAYPSNFSGTYIEENILYILWTELSEQQKHFYDNLLKDYVDYYSYKIVEYSYNDLMSLCETTYEKLKNKIQISGYSIDVINNSAKIGVIESDRKKADQYLRDFNTKNNDPIYYALQEYPEAQASTLMGGTPCSTNNIPFTLGMCGTYNGQNAAVTCGHSMTINSAVKYLSTTIGTTNYIQTSYGDFSIILTNNNATLTNRVKTSGNTYAEIEGTINNPPIGTIVCKYGRITGYKEYGRIFETGYTAHYVNHNITPRDLKVVEWSECATIEGDSGGPYFMDDYGYTVFCGVHSGKRNDQDKIEGSITLFTPYYYITAAGFDAAVD